MKKSFCMGILICTLTLGLVQGFSGTAGAVWSCWYWPWYDFADTSYYNLYDYNEAMYLYDRLSGANSQGWEYQYHGPPQNPDKWWGHCHAWSGASVWEPQPTKSRTVGGIKFWIRDRKGLLIETYNACANGDMYELYARRPSPGTFWYWLRRELGGVSPIHGKKMAFVGELYYGSEVWNYPIYRYSVTLTSSNPAAGTIKIWVASDAKPTYADQTTLWYRNFTYKFKGVRRSSNGTPLNSGVWIGSGPYSRPDAIWRPKYARTWMQYVDNTQLSSYYLKLVLE